MRRLELIRRVRSMTRDFSNSIFREQDIVDFLNEGIDRVVQILPKLKGMEYLLAQEQKVILMPREYQHILAVYATSRCFSQDEGHYQASTLMNEFEVKLDELKLAIENGDIVITDSDGNVIEDGDGTIDYVDLKAYWD